MSHTSAASPSVEQIRAKVERDVRQRLLRESKQRRGFTWHAMVFAMAMAAIVGIDLHYTPNLLWFVWPLAGWGAALALHGYAVFGRRASLMPSAEQIEAEVQREMARRGS